MIRNMEELLPIFVDNYGEPLLPPSFVADLVYVPQFFNTISYSSTLFTNDLDPNYNLVSEDPLQYFYFPELSTKVFHRLATSSLQFKNIGFFWQSYLNTNNGFTVAIDWFASQDLSSTTPPGFSDIDAPTSLLVLATTNSITLQVKPVGASPITYTLTGFNVPYSLNASAYSMFSLVCVFMKNDPTNSNFSSVAFYNRDTLLIKQDLPFVMEVINNSFSVGYRNQHGTQPVVFKRPLTQPEIASLFSSGWDALPRLQEENLRHLRNIVDHRFLAQDPYDSYGHVRSSVHGTPNASAPAATFLSSSVRAGSTYPIKKTDGIHPYYKEYFHFDGTKRLGFHEPIITSRPFPFWFSMIFQSYDTTNLRVVYEYANPNTIVYGTIFTLNGELYYAYQRSGTTRAGYKWTMPITSGIIELIIKVELPMVYATFNGVLVTSTPFSLDLPLVYSNQTPSVVGHTIGGTNIEQATNNTYNFVGDIFYYSFEVATNSNYSHPLTLPVEKTFGSKVLNYTNILERQFLYTLRAQDKSSPFTQESIGTPMPSPVIEYPLNGSLASSFGGQDSLNPVVTATPSYISRSGGQALLIQNTGYYITNNTFSPYVAPYGVKTFSVNVIPPTTYPTGSQAFYCLISGALGFQIYVAKTAAGQAMMYAYFPTNTPQTPLHPYHPTGTGVPIKSVGMNSPFHLAVEYRPAYQMARLFVDGVLVSSGNPVISESNINYPSFVGLGANVQNTTTQSEIATGFAFYGFKIFMEGLTKNNHRELAGKPHITHNWKPVRM